MSSFFEFASETDESVESAARRAAPAPARSASPPRQSGTTAAPRGSSAPARRPPGGPAAPPRTTTTPSRSGTQPGARPAQAGARPAPPAGRPAPTSARTTPAPAASSQATAPGSRAATPARQPAAQGSSGLNLDQFASYMRQGFDFVQGAAQVAQQFTGPRGASAPPAPAAAPDQPAPDQPVAAAVDAPAAAPADPAPPAGVPAPSWTMTGAAAPAPIATDAPATTATAAPGPTSPAVAPGFQLAPLLQALQQRQIPPLPPPVPVAAPVFAAPPAAGPAAPQFDALSLLRLILINPQFQQALQPTMAGTMPRTLHLPVPVAAAPAQMRPVPIPLGAVMNTIAALAGQSLTELHAGTAEDEPEVPGYLVDADGEFIVDPASADDRAALVAHYFRINDQAQQEAWLPQPGRRSHEADDELSESDAWARDAGFRM